MLGTGPQGLVRLLGPALEQTQSKGSGGGAASWGLDKGSTRFLGGTVAKREGGDGSGIRCMANRGALYMVLGKG